MAFIFVENYIRFVESYSIFVEKFIGNPAAVLYACNRSVFAYSQYGKIYFRGLLPAIRFHVEKIPQDCILQAHYCSQDDRYQI